jgi:hypothetical protein
MKYMWPPITLCANGHIICNICKPKVPHCPTCRRQFLNTRNVALEELATEMKYPCTYRNYGCSEIYCFDLIGELHEKYRYISQPCPVNKMNHGNWCGLVLAAVWCHIWSRHTVICVWNTMVFVILHYSKSVSHLLKSKGKWFSLTVTYITAAVISKRYILFCSAVYW